MRHVLFVIRPELISANKFIVGGVTEAKTSNSEETTRTSLRKLMNEKRPSNSPISFSFLNISIIQNSPILLAFAVSFYLMSCFVFGLHHIEPHGSFRKRRGGISYPRMQVSESCKPY